MLRKAFPMLLFAALIMMGLYYPCLASEDETPSGKDPSIIIERQLDALNVDSIQDFLDDSKNEWRNYAPELDVRKWIKGQTVSGRTLLAGMGSYLANEILTHLRLLGQLILLAVLSALITSLQTGFEDQNVSAVASTICYFVAVIIGMNSFYLAAKSAGKAIEAMTSFIYAMLPVMIGLMAAVGSFATAAVLHPAIIASINLLSIVIEKIVLPFTFVFVGLGLVGKISSRIQLGKLAKLFRDGGALVMGLVCTIMLAVTTLKGVGASFGDGLSIKATKLLTGALIPGAGSVISDSIEVMAGCSAFIKGCIGALGAIAIFILAVFPIIKLTAVIFVYKLASAIAEPLGDERLSVCLNHLADGLIMLSTVIAVTGIMFFLCMTIMIGFGNVGSLVR